MERRDMLAAVAAMGTVGSARAAELPKAAPDGARMSADGLKRLSASMKALVDQKWRGGVAYGVVRDGKLVAQEAFGHCSIEKNLPMTADTQFRLYSQSRALTGAAILTLVDEGKLKLDDPVSKYIPEIAEMQVIKEIKGDQIAATEPQKTPMTVKHLFTYTSGLGYARDWPKGAGIDQRDILNLDQTIEVGIKKLAKYPLLYQPGAKWYYGFHSDVLGRVAEVASNQPFNVFLRERLTGKLGMADTDFWVKEGETDRLAEVYGPGEKPGTLINQGAKVPPSGGYSKPCKMFSAGGGLVSTTRDYLRFLQMLLNEGELDGVRVLKPETVRLMLSRHTTPDQGLVNWYSSGGSSTHKGYAWGLAIGVRADEGPHCVPGSPGDATWGGLANTAYFLDPKQKLAAVAMSQYFGGGDEATLPMALRVGVYGALA